MRPTSGAKALNLSAGMNETNVTKLIRKLIEAKAAEVKIGMDVHARDIVICIQVDGSHPMHAQRMTHQMLKVLVRALVQAGLKVYSVYEAGPCGHGLHRDLSELGVVNYVISPRALQDGRGQKTDALDAAALVDGLDRYLRGNKKAFTVNRVPTAKEEQDRSQARLRGQLRADRHVWEARGRSLMLFHGHHICGCWWKPKRWAELNKSLPGWLCEQLQVIRVILLQVDALEQKHRRLLEECAPKTLPKAVGALTWMTLLREICDWARFKNRRQVSSYTGLCPGGYHSGNGPKRDGHINRHGNPRVRHLLIELIWRLVRWQPDYPPVRKLVEGVARGAARRKLAVAAARRLAVDLWRLATGQTTAAKLKLTVLASV
jgi:transposase